MINYVIILAVIIISLGIMASFLFYRWKRRRGIYSISSRATPSYRKISGVEYQMVVKYLQNNQPVNQNDKGKITASYQDPSSILKKHAVISTVCNSVTRFNLRNEQHKTWRYFIDTVEVNLPYQLEPYLQQQNVMEVVETNHLPLIISVNNSSIKDFTQEWPISHLSGNILSEPAAIHERGQQSIKLVRVRKETPEEYRLHNSSNMLDIGLFILSLLFCFFALIAIPILFNWMVAGAIISLTLSLLIMFNLMPFSKKYQDVQCVIGQPRRWELFGEVNKKQKPYISLGSVDLIYPPHWEPYIHHELDQTTNIDMYANGQVLQQGKYLSLNEESHYYPHKKYGRNIVLMGGTLLVMMLMFFYHPLNLPIKLGFTWLGGNESIKVSSFSELEATPLHIGDLISAKGVGMCYMPPNIAEAGQAQFLPFDCSGIYWNNVNSLPMPESLVVNTAISLLESVEQQLHPSDEANLNTNPQLKHRALKSGMNFLNNFPDIILKTNTLCPEDNSCQKLKSALLNLGSTSDWRSLVADAQNGKLDGTNVILRAGSAETLEKLIEATTYEYIRQEIEKASVRLNSPPPGGVLLISDEGKPLVDFISSNLASDMSPLQRWYELQRLSDILMHTPFEANGIITDLRVDANGTQQIILHSEPDTSALTRYMSATLLFVVLLLIFVFNGLLVINRVRLNKKRLVTLKQYYDDCFNSAYPSSRW